MNYEEAALKQSVWEKDQISGAALRGIGTMGRLGDVGRANSALQQQCSPNVGPASEICADLHNLVEAQSRAIRHAESLAIKIFGPVPELDNAKIPQEPSHLSALIARARSQAEEIANRLEGLNANI